MTGPLLTVPEVAELLGCSPKSVRRMIARGDLPAVPLTTRLLRVRAEDVDELILGRLETRSTAGTAYGEGPWYPAGSRPWERW